MTTTIKPAPLLHELTPAAAVRAAFHDPKPEGGKLFIAGREGQRYPDSEPLLSANAYWLTLAQPWRKLFAYFSEEPAPGAYRVEGKTLVPIEDVPQDAQAFATLRGFWKPAQYTVPLTRVTVDGYPADTQLPNATATLWRNPDGELVGVDRDWLLDLTGRGRPWELPGPYGHPWAGASYPDRSAQTGPVLRQLPGGVHKPVAVFLDRVQVLDGHYEGDPGTPERRYVGREVKPEGLKLAAVVMPVRLGTT